jgi:biotin transporter BioY
VLTLILLVDVIGFVADTTIATLVQVTLQLEPLATTAQWDAVALVTLVVDLATYYLSAATRHMPL